MAFKKKLLSVSFQLATGTFDGTDSNTLKLDGLRISSTIQKAGGSSLGTAEIRIYGMTLSQMNQLSTLGMQVMLVPRNIVSLSAGEEGSSMGLVFIGQITNAYADFQAAPDVPFFVQAHVLAGDAVRMIPPTSTKGSADVATLLSGFATQLGLTFENNGIDIKLSNPYLSGSILDQAQEVVNAAGIAWNKGDNGVLAIWPKTGSRGGSIPLISPETGMVGYPSYTAQGILVRTLFNPSISFGGKIQIQSDLKPACKVMTVQVLNHTLDSQVPDGKWFSDIQAYNPDFNPVT